MRNLIPAFFAVLATGFGSGCGPRVVLVPESSPIRLAEPIRAHVYVLEGGEWVRGANAVELTEGLYIVPPSYVDE